MKDGNPGELLTQRGSGVGVGWGVEREHERVGAEFRLLIMDSVIE